MVSITQRRISAKTTSRYIAAKNSAIKCAVGGACLTRSLVSVFHAGDSATTFDTVLQSLARITF